MLLHQGHKLDYFLIKGVKYLIMVRGKSWESAFVSEVAVGNRPRMSMKSDHVHTCTVHLEVNFRL